MSFAAPELKDYAENVAMTDVDFTGVGSSGLPKEKGENVADGRYQDGGG